MTLVQPPQQNKKIIRNLYEQILNTGKLEQLNQVIAEEYVGVRGEKGAAGFAETVAGIRAAFPDIKWTVEELLADGDKVTVRWSWKGTHTGPFRGFPASKKQVTDHAIAIYQLKEGRVTHAWIESDRLGFLQQIGVISPDLGVKPQAKDGK